MDQEPDQHEWNVDVLESTLRKSSPRLTAAVALAAVAAVVSVVGLTRQGTGPIWGLAALLFAAICLSFALRLKTKRDYCRAQLDRIARGESGDVGDES